MIYSPEAISKLQEIVGDKNEEFRKCDLTKEFYSLPQTIGFYVKLTSNEEELIKDLKSNISLDNFLNKYLKGKKPKTSLIVKTRYINYNKEEVIELSEEPDGKSMRIDPKNWSNLDNTNWVFKKYKKGGIGVFCLESPLRSKPLPNQYARMIQYGECLIDTTTTIHP